MPTLIELCDQLSNLCQQYEKSASDNCGTGAGGFQPGNDCARGGGAGATSDSDSRPSNTGDSPESSKPASNFRENVTADEFLTALQATGKPQYISVHSAEELKNHKLILTSDGKAGAAVSPDGDIQNVFNNGSYRGAGAHVLMEAIQQGGITLDCYDSFLPNYYTNFGFTETGRMKFNREYAHPKWDFENDGEPDVVFMALTGESKNGDKRAEQWKLDGKQTISRKSERIYDGSEWDLAKRESVGTVHDRTQGKGIGAGNDHSRIEFGDLSTSACDRGVVPKLSEIDRQKLYQILMRLSQEVTQAIESYQKAAGDGGCGTGAGGFQPGNDCASGGSAGGSSGSSSGGHSSGSQKPQQSDDASKKQDSEHFSTEKLFGNAPTATSVQDVSTKEELYAAAPKTKDAFDKSMNTGQGVDKAIGATVAHVKTPEDFQNALKGEGHVVILAPVKGEKRAVEKVEGKFGGDWSRLTDVVRGTVVVQNKSDIPTAVTAIKSELGKRGFELVEVDNRMEKPLTSGYRDINTKWKSGDGLIVELQINTKSMTIAKETGGHVLYEKMRSIAEQSSKRELTSDEKNTVTNLEKEMRVLYNKAWSD